MFSTPCGCFVASCWSFRRGDVWPCLLTCRSCLDVRGVVGASVAGRRVVASLWRVVAVLVTLWMVVAVGDGGGFALWPCCFVWRSCCDASGTWWAVDGLAAVDCSVRKV